MIGLSSPNRAKSPDSLGRFVTGENGTIGSVIAFMSGMTKRILSLISLSTLAVFFGVTPARADAVLTFTQGTTAGGLLSYIGGTNPLVGLNIPINIVNAQGSPTPANAGDHGITNGLLNFTSGNLALGFGGVDIFAGGGTFTITGGVPDAGIADGSTLLSGSFSSDGVSISDTGVRSTGIIGGGDDSKDPDLLAYFGLPASAIFAFSISTNESTGSFSSGPTHSFSFAADNTSVLNTTDSSAVPEPASLLLLGTGLSMAGAAIRRRTAKRA